jgi:hypothetical protein
MIGSCQEESWIPDQVRDDDNLKSALKCQFPQIRDEPFFCDPACHPAKGAVSWRPWI